MLRELSAEFRKFGSFVIQGARAELTKDKKGGGELFNSLNYELTESENLYDRSTVSTSILSLLFSLNFSITSFISVSALFRIPETLSFSFSYVIFSPYT